MAMVELSVVPLGTKSPSVSSYVARCLEVLQQEKEISYRLTPMGTIIDGELEQVLAIVRRMHEEPFKFGVSRVVTSIRIDDRRDKTLTMDGKLSAVESKLSKAGENK